MTKYDFETKHNMKIMTERRDEHLFVWLLENNSLITTCIFEILNGVIIKKKIFNVEWLIPFEIISDLDKIQFLVE